MEPYSLILHFAYCYVLTSNAIFNRIMRKRKSSNHLHPGSAQFVVTVNVSDIGTYRKNFEYLAHNKLGSTRSIVDSAVLTRLCELEVSFAWHEGAQKLIVNSMFSVNLLVNQNFIKNSHNRHFEQKMSRCGRHFVSDSTLLIRLLSTHLNRYWVW